ncbi:MAG: PRC-barrel domain-containing protein [Candidatus Berkelbacteria bacterium]|nr:PRC-barrel domain-containing protein [Candidatus Berkelbacteria bacterium]
MLIEKSNLVGLPIFELENQLRVAELVDFFIDDDETKVEAVIAKTDGLIHHQKYISAKEVIDISKAALIIQDVESLVEPKEMIRLHKKSKKRAKIVGEKVYTKKGEFLGTVFDYVIENSSLSITRIYLKKLFDQRIIHSSAIVKIEQHKIIVKDNFEMVKPEPIPTGAHAELA